jgi:hypothetical protein
LPAAATGNDRRAAKFNVKKKLERTGTGAWLIFRVLAHFERLFRFHSDNERRDAKTQRIHPQISQIFCWQSVSSVKSVDLFSSLRLCASAFIFDIEIAQYQEQAGVKWLAGFRWSANAKRPDTGAPDVDIEPLRS